MIPITLRTRKNIFLGSDDWQEFHFKRRFDPAKTAILICDMWDLHWCAISTNRFNRIAHQMSDIIESARDQGFRIIHSPSDCMDFYKDLPQRQSMISLSRVQPPDSLHIIDPPLPIDASDNGCEDDPSPEPYSAWTRQHAAIRIAEGDFISDNGGEVYSFFAGAEIKDMFIMGVAVNMCVLGRTFAIRQMTNWGINCVLVRDMTDSMYNPKMPPYVSHDKGTELVVQHIEKYWCPSCLSEELLF